MLNYGSIFLAPSCPGSYTYVSDPEGCFHVSSSFDTYAGAATYCSGESSGTRVQLTETDWVKLEQALSL